MEPAFVSLGRTRATVRGQYATLGQSVERLMMCVLRRAGLYTPTSPTPSDSPHKPDPSAAPGGRASKHLPLVLALLLSALCLLDAAPVGAAHETAPTGVSVSGIAVETVGGHLDQARQRTWLKGTMACEVPARQLARRR